MTDLVGLQCPRCGSDDFRALSLLHSQGRSQSIAFLHGGATHGSAVGVGASQTELSQQVAPPIELGLGLPILCGILIAIGVLFVGAMAASAGSAVAVFLLYGAPIAGIVTVVVIYLPRRQWNRTELPKLMAEWRTSFLCMRCATRFRPDPRRPKGINAGPPPDVPAQRREATRRFR
jgi:DNA-directed RNA polymerase subunit RPC12/RpoP